MSGCQDFKNEYEPLLPQSSIVDFEELEGWKHVLDSGAVEAKQSQGAVFAPYFMFPLVLTKLLTRSWDLVFDSQLDTCYCNLEQVAIFPCIVPAYTKL